MTFSIKNKRAFKHILKQFALMMGFMVPFAIIKLNMDTRNQYYANVNKLSTKVEAPPSVRRTLSEASDIDSDTVRWGQVLKRLYKTPGEIKPPKQEVKVKVPAPTPEPYANFHWPLDIRPQVLVADYYSKTPVIKEINRHNFNFTIIPAKKCTANGSLVTILIKTAARDRLNRKVLRNAWITDIVKSGLSYVFLIGKCRPNDTECEETLLEEKRVYDDLIQEDFIDSYTNNTYKLTMGLRYLTEYCDHKYTFAFFIDGDYALNINNLLGYLRSANKTNFYGGQMWFAAPFRDPTHKHYRSLQQYPFELYPPFIAAGAMLLSADVAKQFFILSHYTAYFPFDDVFYGFIAKKLNINPVQMDKILPSTDGIPKKRQLKNHKIIGSHRFGNLAEVEYIHRQYHALKHKV